MGGEGEESFLKADDGRIVRRDQRWVQDDLTVTVAIFRQMRLDMNLVKTKGMV